MSLSKRYYEESYTKANNYIEIKYEPGQKFRIKNKSNQSENGNWQVISESNLKHVYNCNRVLKHGKLSISNSRRNFRTFSSNEIFEALQEE